MQIKGSKVIVTGAAGGMGAHFCRRLAEAGAMVAAGDINDGALAELAASSEKLSGQIFSRKLDVAKDSEVESFVSWAYETMGGLTGLINNAGILRDGLLVKKDRTTGELTKLSNEQWQSVIDVNLTGATFMVRDAVFKMVENGQSPGVIINMSSLARYGNRGQSNYVSAKAALAANTVTWGREFARFGIRVGAIAPGMIETPMTSGNEPERRERP